jgi:hypothetical protein
MAFASLDKPSLHFDAILYDGASGAKTVTGYGFQPDMVWYKERTDAYSWGLYDSSRGIKRWFIINNSQSENNNAGASVIDASLTAFTSDGFTVATMSSDPIGNRSTAGYYKSYCWKANGGTKTTNDASATSVGTIDSEYQANTTAGFSIVEYTGTGSAGTVAHGLGTQPRWLFIKRRRNSDSSGGTSTGCSVTYMEDLKSDYETDFMSVSETSSAADDATKWNDTAPTTTTFSIGTDDNVNASGSLYVAYVWCEKQGFSKIGHYVGNGQANGTFIYCGFRPKMVICKQYDNNRQWVIQDSVSQAKDKSGSTTGADAIGGNPVEQSLGLDTANAENSGAPDVDFYATGFKLRSNDDMHNKSDEEYFYVAFAEAPLVGSNNITSNAR